MCHEKGVQSSVTTKRPRLDTRARYPRRDPRPDTRAQIPSMSEPNPHPIRLEKATYRIGSATLVSELTVDVEAGETLVLVGRSGSGKTTALRLINRLLEPTTGQVLVEGRSTIEWDPIALRRKIGYVIQEVGLFPHFTVERNVTLVPTLEGWPDEKKQQRCDELLQIVGLDPADLNGRLPHQLSGGQRQRVGVARALAADPPILLMDEPFGALDPITRAEIQREFLAMRKKLGKTIVFVTHDVSEALLLGDRIGVMENGRLVWLGNASEFRASDDPRVLPYLESLL